MRASFSYRNENLNDILWFKGLYTDGVSNGFFIDSTPPEIEEGPKFTRDFGLVANTQFCRTSVKVGWKVADPESHIERQYLSLKSHLGSDFALSSTQVNIYPYVIGPPSPPLPTTIKIVVEHSVLDKWYCSRFYFKRSETSWRSHVLCYTCILQWSSDVFFVYLFGCFSWQHPSKSR